MSVRWRPLAIAMATAIVVDATVPWIQTLARGVHPRPGEIRSVSDLVLATAFAAALYLWLSLRDTRAALGMAERTQLVLDTQLSLAADVQRRLLPSLPAATDTGRQNRCCLRRRAGARVSGAADQRVSARTSRRPERAGSLRCCPSRRSSLASAAARPE